MPNNAEAARKRRMKARICGNCEQPGQDMRRWGGSQIPICRVCAAVLDTLQTQLRHRTIEDKTIWESFEAGIEAGNSGDPCLPSSEYRTSRSAVVLWGGWMVDRGRRLCSIGAFGCGGSGRLGYPRITAVDVLFLCVATRDTA